MLKNAIFQQKTEKENYLSKEFIPRYGLEKMKEYLNSSLIKIISGPRRAGKSVFCFLMLKNKNFAYLNFDDENILKVKDYEKIIQALFEIYPSSEYYMFDEIQNLDKWELFVNKLYRRGMNLIITGSNSKLLSHEMATTLTGRYIMAEVFPFNFKEFLIAKNFSLAPDLQYSSEQKGRLLSLLDEYLLQGGFPEIIIQKLNFKTYLETLLDAVILKDVVKRYNVRYVQKIYDLAGYLINQYGTEFSFTRIKNNLQFRSTVTVQNYIRYLEESYLFFSLNRFSFQPKEQIRTPKKIYIADNGLISAKSVQVMQNKGRLMENLVFIELLRQGLILNINLFYYKTRNQREVDFVIKKDLKIDKLIQVCMQMDNPSTLKREYQALIEASEELKINQLLVITWDLEEKITFNQKIIELIPLWKWLLNGF